MTYSVRLMAAALRDLDAIEGYYEQHAPRDTERCLDAIEATLGRLSLHAHQAPQRRLGLRRVSTEAFRYHVWYRLFEYERFVQVVAILHHARGDEALASRLP
ncbi:type II toxin-antitoxin system RelE/ParE family toxin [Leucobacter albus]|uniref:Type II toxin-antitoxin system RelE/ParE family toxin n=1 Tax=Leucobacter albus TaxID=272210 RepID=A0ABW3TI28_9MICO